MIYIYIYAYIWVKYLHFLNPEGRRPLGKPRRRWEDNIKMNL